MNDGRIERIVPQAPLERHPAVATKG
jgi:hypothetical protein